jgi:hypothetical protein
VRLLDAATGKDLGPPLKSDKPVVQLAFSADSRRFLTARWEAAGIVVEVRDVTTGQPLGPPLNHAVRNRQPLDILFRLGTAWAFLPGPESHPLDTAVLSADGGRVVTFGLLLPSANGNSGVVGGIPLPAAPLASEARVWDVATGKEVGPPLKLATLVSQAGFLGDGGQLVTLGHPPPSLTEAGGRGQGGMRKSRCGKWAPGKRSPATPGREPCRPSPPTGAAC